MRKFKTCEGTYLHCGVMKPILDNNRQESPKPIQNRDHGDLDYAMQPALHILGRLLDVCFAVVPAAAGIGLGAFGAETHDLLFGGVEKVGGFVVFGDEEDAAEGPEDGDDAFNDV